jgi:glycosyltransferase involved in cell wall biosynthesis
MPKMAVDLQPRVSVLIPVYNGETHIATAIRSVLRQTYVNFDLTIVNNTSTDRTRGIAEEFASADPRIRIHDNPAFLSVVENHNRAFSLASPEAKYVKILGADDWLFPACLEALVGVAESNPAVGMVSSYVLCGSRIGWDGLSWPGVVVDGRTICRMRLLDGLKVFGGPSASLIRKSALRQPFYNPLNYHGDNEACLELLKDHDFGFVHQVLSYNRKGEDSRTTAYLDRVGSQSAADMDEVTRFGPVYLTPAEHRERLRDVTTAYYRFLARNVFEFRNREFRHYHRTHLKAMGYPIRYPLLAFHIAARLADALLNPKRTIEGGLRRLLRPRAGSRTVPRQTPAAGRTKPDPTGTAAGASTDRKEHARALH